MQLISMRDTPDGVPDFQDFARHWCEQMRPEWKASYRETVECTMRLWLLPTFSTWPVDRIQRATLLEFRAAVSAHPRLPSTARVNKIMGILGACLAEAARRYGFPDPRVDVKRLRERRRDIHPFTLPQVESIVREAGPAWQDYYLVRFFTGMRTAEIDGLQWKFIDWDRRQILVRETIVNAQLETTKTVASERAIDMAPGVYEALERQKQRTGHLGRFVFCARNGSPLRHGNVRRRVWLPMLAKLGLEPRRQYETRHTYATLMLAAGENPEYIRRQMGHSNVEMLFSVYSRYVPNLTRRDGSAFGGLIQSGGVAGGAHG